MNPYCRPPKQKRSHHFDRVILASKVRILARRLFWRSFWFKWSYIVLTCYWITSKSSTRLASSFSKVSSRVFLVNLIQLSMPRMRLCRSIVFYKYFIALLLCMWLWANYQIALNILPFVRTSILDFTSMIRLRLLISCFSKSKPRLYWLNPCLSLILRIFLMKKSSALDLAFFRLQPWSHRFNQ